VKKREGMAWRGGDPQGAGTPCEWSGRWDCLWLFLSWNTQGSCGHWLDLVIKPIAAEASGWLLAVWARLLLGRESWHQPCAHSPALA
jgi:hypothetical protein